MRHRYLLLCALAGISLLTMGQTRRVLRGSVWFEQNISPCTSAAQVIAALGVSNVFSASGGTNATLPGELRAYSGVFSNAVSGGGVTVGALGGGASLFQSAGFGTAIQPVAGSSYDFTIFRADGGSAIAYVPTGTSDVNLTGALNTAGVLSSVKAIQVYQGSLTHAGTVTINFDGASTVNSLTLTGNLTLAFSNLATNRTARVLIKNAQATNCTLTLPSGVHGYYTATLSNGWHMVSCESWGSVASNVWVSTSSDGTY